MGKKYRKLTRKINGKTFIFTQTANSKEKAKRIAEKNKRKYGGHYRIIPSKAKHSKGYDIYSEQKPALVNTYKKTS